MEDKILKYAEKIENSPLFSIDKEKFSNNYKRESRKLVDYLFLYLKACKSKNEEYGFEIYKVSELCIKNYDSSKGSFLNYFNKAWAEEFRHLQANEWCQEMVNLIHMPDEKQRILKKFLQYEKSTERDIKSPEFWKGLKKILSPKEIEEVKDIYIHRTISIHQQKDGEEYDIFEMSSPEESYLDKMIFQENAQENAQEKITKISDVYILCRKDQKPILKVLLTSWLSLFIRWEIPECCNHFQNQPFFDNDTYQECINNNKEMPHKAIANKFSKRQSSISRTWTRFIKKLELI